MVWAAEVPEPHPDRILAFENARAFGCWLENNHAEQSELWLKIFKKASGQKTVTWNEAVIEALCWGWIDGVKKSWDAESYLQRFTPRRKKSLWSKRNREHVEALISQKRMQPSGMEHVLAAQADGRWEVAYAPQSEMKIPEDFLSALSTRPQAQRFFESLNRQNLFAIVNQLGTAKRPETRQRRMNKILESLEQGKKLH